MMASCREIRQALGVYVLGAIDPAERAQVDEHLAACRDCREELASLAGLPAMLRKVPIVEAERLAAPGQAPGFDEMPSEQMLTSLVSRTRNVRRIHRWRALAAAAAVAVVALGTGAVVTSAMEPAAQSAAALHWRTAVGADAATGARLTVMYRRLASGTEMRVQITGVPAGSVCEFEAVDSTGALWTLGGWRARDATTWYPASSWLDESTISHFEVAVNGEVVASAPA
jgi:predicted anti-sigma-YlaC factor YlaD